MDSILCIKNLEKSYGEVKVLRGLNLSVKRGEFISLLGPSGCGKTTLLRIIAGLTGESGGTLTVNGKDMRGLPPYKRNNGMVFQNYALFPHMTIEKNIAFGMKMHNFKKEEIREKIEWGLSLVHMDGLGKRYPRELSGGQQQRVALARALVLNPTLLLMDEPLSNLDAKLRKEMRIEIRRIQKDLNITTIFVTHDQEEALTMSDRIAVMNQGRFEQVGTPTELYETPQTAFVAGFIGNTNLLACIIGGSAAVYCGEEHFSLSGESISEKEEVWLSIRPERVLVGQSIPKGKNGLRCRVIAKVYLGSAVRMILQDMKQNTLQADIPSNYPVSQFQEGENLYAYWAPEDQLLISRGKEA